MAIAHEGNQEILVKVSDYVFHTLLNIPTSQGQQVSKDLNYAYLGITIMNFFVIT